MHASRFCHPYFTLTCTTQPFNTTIRPSSIEGDKGGSNGIFDNRDYKTLEDACAMSSPMITGATASRQLTIKCIPYFGNLRFQVLSLHWHVLLYR